MKIRNCVELDGNWSVNRQLGLGARLVLRESNFRSGPYAGKDVPLVPKRILALRADWMPMMHRGCRVGWAL
ncbi:hypothetical protein [Hydrogenophaga sp.]|uniref:hypothetical protein n=1 Tax=Hydrogenophaga sp. TaxID=1904254 RepID=UPI00272FAA1A|nr:hypothetical protein [Hydrogenophaga sp.]MDP2015693.1 hypothetical protein [Hydrogenophaga sp.]MDP3164769.1 hypothetical protein [Hydrogenophaga sp.]MDP3810685.1 hypothetical protein [Hydrogenophaga sp.]